MTQEEFIKELKREDYSYKIEGDKVVFKNVGNVDLDDLTSLPPDVVFENGGWVYLRSLTSLPPGVEFKNYGDVNLKALTGGWFSDWKGNIKGIDPNRLLNAMIKQGVFER